MTVRRRRVLVAGAALLALLLAVVLTAPRAAEAWERTTHPRPDAPPHVDALLVLYSQPRVYDAALDLIGTGITDRVFVSAYLGPDGHQKLCGEPARTDPRLRGVHVECFSPDPVTTQGEAMFAAGRMRELGLRDLGVLTFGQHLERARLLTQRCWTPEAGTVAMYQFDGGHAGGDGLVQDLYGTVAYAKAAATPGCAEELPAPLRWGLDAVKRVLGQPVESLVRGVRARATAVLP